MTVDPVRALPPSRQEMSHARNPPPMVHDRRGLPVLLWQVLTTTETAPLDPPAVPSDLADMPPVLRIHACLRLFLLDMEYAMSPGGQLRGLVKMTCRISLIVAFWALCLAAVLACVSVALAIAVVMTGRLVTVLWNLVTAALLMVALLILGAVLLWVARAMAHASRGGR